MTADVVHADGKCHYPDQLSIHRPVHKRTVIGGAVVSLAVGLVQLFQLVISTISDEGSEMSSATRTC